MEKKLALELVDFLYDSPSACHGVKATQKILDENGFIEIKETIRLLSNQGPRCADWVLLVLHQFSFTLEELDSVSSEERGAASGGKYSNKSATLKMGEICHSEGRSMR